MGIPLSFLYYFYLLGVVVFLLFSFFNIYHLIRFGLLTVGNVAVISFYLVIAISILMLAANYLSQFDWQEIIWLVPTLNPFSA
ncbi:MAG TPA: hypothetical protein VJG65_00475 [Patescibacteria group bacterium]|nr:hypothetical protein [Patescibacteria group bacterium]